MVEMSWASLAQEGRSVVQVIRKVLSGKGTPQEECFVSRGVSPELLESVATVMAAEPFETVSMQQPEISVKSFEGRLVTVDDPRRCAVCGWPLSMDSGTGCVVGVCSRPRPATLYSPGRAEAEAKMMLGTGSAGRIPAVDFVRSCEAIIDGRQKHSAWAVGGLTLVIEKDGGVTWIRVVASNRNVVDR